MSPTAAPEVSAPPDARRVLRNPPLGRRLMTKCHVSGRRANQLPVFRHSPNGLPEDNLPCPARHRRPSLHPASLTYAVGTPSSTGLAKNAVAGAYHDAFHRQTTRFRPLFSHASGNR